MLKAEGLEKIYGDGEAKIKAVGGVSVEFKPDTIYSIMGKSGSGKSTLLSVLGGVNPPTGGRVICDGDDIYRLSESKLAKYRSIKIGFVYQSYQLIPELTVMQNVVLPILIQKKKVDYDKVYGMLDRLGIEDKGKKYPSQLSGGQQQRTAIARAFISDPEILLCDEPTGNLDNATSVQVMELLTELVRERKKTAVIVTHDPGIASLCDVKYVMTDGSLAPA